jgi:PAP2 superfamily
MPRWPAIRRWSAVPHWPAVPHWLRPAGTGVWRRVLRELVYVGVFLGIYEEIREHMVQAGGAAASHALSVVSAEQSLGLFREQTVQALFIRSDNVMDVFNAYYGGTHFLVPAVVLAWLLWRHPERYARARTALALTTAVAFVCFWLFPVAPPRLLPARFGIVDTLTMASPAGHAEGALISAAGDQYASMPSLHVAWAVWCAVALYPVIRHRALRILAAAYPVMTVLVVVATGNHYFLDVAAGALLTGVAWVAVTRLGSWAAVQRDRGHVTPAEAGPSGRGSRVARGGQPALRARACGRGGHRRGVIQPRFCAAMRSGHRAATSRAVDPRRSFGRAAGRPGARDL